MGDVDKWVKLEETVRRVIKEELSILNESISISLSKLGVKTKIEFVNGSFVGITQLHRDTWKAAYPSVDIESELSKAAAYIASNPHKAPRSQIARFLNAWLSRSHDRAAIRSIPLREEKRSCAYCDLPSTGVVNGIFHCRAHGLDAMDEKPRPMRAA